MVVEAWKWHPHKVYIHDQGQAGGHPVEPGCILPRLCFHTCDHRERLGYTGMRSTKLRAFLSSGAARPSTGQGTPSFPQAVQIISTVNPWVVFR